MLTNTVAALLALSSLASAQAELSSTTSIFTTCRTYYASGTFTRTSTPTNTKTLSSLLTSTQEVTYTPSTTKTVSTVYTSDYVKTDTVTVTKTTTTTTTPSMTHTVSTLPGQEAIASGISGASPNKRDLEARAVLAVTSSAPSGYHTASVKCFAHSRTTVFTTTTVTAKSTKTITTKVPSATTSSATSTKTTTSTKTKTVKQSAATPTFYAACDASDGHVIGSVNGDMILTVQGAPKAGFVDYGSSSSAYDCCVTCQQDITCNIAIFDPAKMDCAAFTGPKGSFVEFKVDGNNTAEGFRLANGNSNAIYGGVYA